MYQICQAEECDKDNVLRYIFTAIEKRHNANKLQQVVADSNCDLAQFIKDGNFGRWLEENVSSATIWPCDIQPCDKEFFNNLFFHLIQKFTNMVRRGARGIGDVMKHLEEMLQQKSSNDNIMDYISVSWLNFSQHFHIFF